MHTLDKIQNAVLGKKWLRIPNSFDELLLVTIECHPHTIGSTCLSPNPRQQLALLKWIGNTFKCLHMCSNYDDFHDHHGTRWRCSHNKEPLHSMANLFRCPFVILIAGLMYQYRGWKETRYVAQICFMVERAKDLGHVEVQKRRSIYSWLWDACS